MCVFQFGEHTLSKRVLAADVTYVLFVASFIFLKILNPSGPSGSNLTVVFKNGKLLFPTVYIRFLRLARYKR
jgi:hypothetical protein